MPSIPSPTFDGGNASKARHFIELFEGYCASANLNNNDRCLPFLAALQGPALTWLRLWREENADNAGDYAATLAAFRARYDVVLPRATRLRMLMECRQAAGENVRDFSERALTHAKACMTNNPPNWAPLAVAADNVGNATNAFKRKLHFHYQRLLAMDVFCWGLLSSLRDQVLALDIDDFDNLVAAAARIEEAQSKERKPAPISALAPAHHLAPVQAPPAPAAAAMFATHRAPSRGRPAAAGGARPRSRSSSAGRNRSAAPGNRFAAKPHPSQPRSHSVAIECNYCGGTYHTERFCLAKEELTGIRAQTPGTFVHGAPPQHVNAIFPTEADLDWLSSRPPSSLPPVPPPGQPAPPSAAAAAAPLSAADSADLAALVQSFEQADF